MHSRLKQTNRHTCIYICSEREGERERERGLGGHLLITTRLEQAKRHTYMYLHLGGLRVLAGWALAQARTAAPDRLNWGVRDHHVPKP